MLLLGAGRRKESYRRHLWVICFITSPFPPEVPPVCRLELQTYPCDKPNVQYFFNLRTMTCEALQPDLCSTTMNTFPDEETCKDFCEPSKSECFICGASISSFLLSFYGKINHLVWNYMVCMPEVAQLCDIACASVCASVCFSGIKPRLCQCSQLLPWRKHYLLIFPYVDTSWGLMRICKILKAGLWQSH